VCPAESICSITATAACCRNGSSRSLWADLTVLTRPTSSESRSVPCFSSIVAQVFVTSAASPCASGFFFDDNYGSRGGASEEDPHNIEDCGLTPTEAAAVSKGWRENTAAVGKAVLQKGGFAVPFFIGAGRNITDPKSTCKADLARLCKVNQTTKRPDIHDQALMLEFSRVQPGLAPPGWMWLLNGSLPFFEQDLATFLLARGPHAWIGYVWSGCTDSGYP
jgi:hypothetical protein